MRPRQPAKWRGIVGVVALGFGGLMALGALASLPELRDLDRDLTGAEQAYTADDDTVTAAQGRVANILLDYPRSQRAYATMACLFWAQDRLDGALVYFSDSLPLPPRAAADPCREEFQEAFSWGQIDLAPRTPWFVVKATWVDAREELTDLVQASPDIEPLDLLPLACTLDERGVEFSAANVLNEGLLDLQFDDEAIDPLLDGFEQCAQTLDPYRLYEEGDGIVTIVFEDIEAVLAD